MNEEEVKTRLILPWLQDIGVATDELKLEISFSIRIGTNIIKIGDPTRPREQRARLAILVGRGDRNLLM